ncbi:uncharacterized protein BJ171DRAFT_570074 [Polychytrium aggregatum]|uniref:uncharacterized protein n=1 Tax=Polychytrium aggregatum TaxID=110093 RepID=UPI0022FE05DE|nr:uncharacterized protein BJ171DRAFT_570074 [Polychytrium aggregatum]KAI9201813.1 hypothetical protein BJ171DRAFT_570074 [Polychytrium aggregatum]
MAASDRNALLDMGFSTNKVDRALAATGNAGLQPALDWLIAHIDDPDTEEPASSSAPEPSAASDSQMTDAHDGEITAEEATAQSLRCDECGKLLRNAAAAEFHAAKTQHTSFSESTEAIKPLTAEEKAQKLADLQAKLAAKREAQKAQAAIEAREQERIRRKAGQEMAHMREELKVTEMQKAIEQRKQEKLDEKAARERVRMQIEQDKKDRAAKEATDSINTCVLAKRAAPPLHRRHGRIRRERHRIHRSLGNHVDLTSHILLSHVRHQREAERLASLGQSASPAGATSASIVQPPPSASSSASSSAAKNYTESRLQIRVPDGPPLTTTFKADDTLEAVYQFLAAQRPGSSYKLLQTFPRKVLDGPDRSKTLKELGLVPSAALVAQP